MKMQSYNSLVEHLPSKYEVLGSIPCTKGSGRRSKRSERGEGEDGIFSSIRAEDPAPPPFPCISQGKAKVSQEREGFDPCAQFQVAAQQQESATTQKAEREVSHMVVVMVGSFCLCYVPYAALAMYMVNNRNHGLDLRLVTIPAFFSKSSCVYNPIIYCFMNKQVKQSIYIPTRFWSTRPWFLPY